MLSLGSIGCPNTNLELKCGLSSQRACRILTFVDANLIEMPPKEWVAEMQQKIVSNLQSQQTYKTGQILRASLPLLERYDDTLDLREWILDLICFGKSLPAKLTGLLRICERFRQHSARNFVFILLFLIVPAMAKACLGLMKKLL